MATSLQLNTQVSAFPSSPPTYAQCVIGVPSAKADLTTVKLSAASSIPKTNSRQAVMPLSGTPLEQEAPTARKALNGEMTNRIPNDLTSTSRNQTGPLKESQQAAGLSARSPQQLVYTTQESSSTSYSG
jgi:hypothetical protein